MIEVIRTYTGGAVRKVSVTPAYRCKLCGQIWTDIVKDRDKAYFHSCKQAKNHGK